MIKYDYLTYQNRMIDDLCELISLPTVNNDSPEPGMPFGKDVEKRVSVGQRKVCGIRFQNYGI